MAEHLEASSKAFTGPVEGATDNESSRVDSRDDGDDDDDDFDPLAPRYTLIDRDTERHRVRRRRRPTCVWWGRAR